MKIDIDQIINECVEAAHAAALAQWEQDGKQDRGSCGGYMLSYKANTKFGKALIARDLAYQSEGAWVFKIIPEGIRSQNSAIEEKAKRAFMAKAIEHGIQPSKHWSYVD